MTWQCSTTPHVSFKPTAVACPVVATDSHFWTRIRTFRGPMSIWSIISNFASTLEEYQEVVAVSDNVAVVPAAHENLARLYWTTEAFTGGAGLAVCSSYYFSLEGAWRDARLLHPSWCGLVYRSRKHRR